MRSSRSDIVQPGHVRGLEALLTAGQNPRQVKVVVVRQQVGLLNHTVDLTVFVGGALTLNPVGAGSRDTTPSRNGRST